MSRSALAVLAAGALVGVVTAQPISTVSPQPARFGAASYFSETEKDFGVTALGPSLVHYFAITNTTKQKVTMGVPRIQCGCVSAQLMKGDLAPGETTYLVAHMNTAKIPTTQLNGPKSVTVSVPFTSPTFEEVVTTIKCVCRTDLLWSTSDGVSFGTVTKGKGATAKMEVTLFNNAGWEIKDITSSGAYVKAEAKATKKTTNTVTYEITCTLDGKCPAGSWMSDLTVTTNAVGIEKMRVPVTVSVEQEIAATPGVADLGAMVVGGAKSLDVTLTGKEAFKVLEVKGGDASVTVTPTTEGSKTQHTLKIDLKAATAGTLKKDITIKTDNKDQPEVILPVSVVVTK